MPSLIRQSRLVVRKSEAFKMLIDFLCGRFTYHDREHWLDEIRSHRLLLNGVEADDAAILREADVLEYLPVPRPEPPVDFGTTVLAECGDFVFLNKRGNIPCHPAGCFFNHTLWAQLKCGEIPGVAAMDGIHFVSRLDRETSGIVMLARTSQAARAGELALARPDAVKEYRVLVEGDFPETADASGFLWNARDAVVAKRRRFSVAKPDFPVEKLETCRTLFRCVRRFDGISEVIATLVTGRMHQIRATLCSMGFPVVGDKVYGIDETIFLRFIDNAMTERDRARLRLPGQALHAWHLHLTLPGDTAPIDITAPGAFDLDVNH